MRSYGGHEAGLPTPRENTMTAPLNGAFGEQPQTATIDEIGKASKQLADLTEELKNARESGVADRVEQLAKAQGEQAQILSTLKQKHDTEVAAAEAKAKDDEVTALIEWSKTAREPSKAREIGGYARPSTPHNPDTKGAFLFG